MLKLRSRPKNFVFKLCISRDVEKACEFGKLYNAQSYYDSLEALGADNDIDAVYIASPNSLHAPQAMQMLKAGKHVICEKPMASNYPLAQAMFKTAEENNVVLFEAFMSPYTPNFQVLKDSLPAIAPLRHATISYCQYSSRYQKYLNGENPNTFNPEFSNGSIMDTSVTTVLAPRLSCLASLTAYRSKCSHSAFWRRWLWQCDVGV